MKEEIKRSFKVTIDRDLHDEFLIWMDQNNFSAGEEAAAMKAAMRLVIKQDPIPAWLSDAKARAYERCTIELYQKFWAFARELSAEYQSMLKTTGDADL